MRLTRWRFASPNLTDHQCRAARTSIGICATNIEVFITEDCIMPEVHSVQVQIERPKGTFAGRVVEGRYIVEGNVLSLTNHDGVPVRDAEGKAYTHKLEPGDNPKQDCRPPD